MLILGPQLVAMGWLQKLGDRCQMVQLERSQTREGFAQHVHTCPRAQTGHLLRGQRWHFATSLLPRKNNRNGFPSLPAFQQYMVVWGVGALLGVENGVEHVPVLQNRHLLLLLKKPSLGCVRPR